MSHSLQLAQVYIAALVAGGVLCGGSLLVGNFGKRARESFTPAAWVVALGSGLVLAGIVGVLAVVCWPSPGQRGSVLPALSAWAFGALVGFGLQRRGARLAKDADGAGEAQGQVASPPAEP